VHTFGMCFPGKLPGIAGKSLVYGLARRDVVVLVRVSGLTDGMNRLFRLAANMLMQHCGLLCRSSEHERPPDAHGDLKLE
jgi:hypothetical protein